MTVIVSSLLAKMGIKLSSTTILPQRTILLNIKNLNITRGKRLLIDSLTIMDAHNLSCGIIIHARRGYCTGKPFMFWLIKGIHVHVGTFRWLNILMYLFY